MAAAHDTKAQLASTQDEKDTVRHLDNDQHSGSSNDGIAGTGLAGIKIGDIVINPHMTAEEKAAAIKLANDADPGPPLFSWRYMKFVITALLVILNSGDNGEYGSYSFSRGVLRRAPRRLTMRDRVRRYRHELRQLDGTVSILLRSPRPSGRRYLSRLCKSLYPVTGSVQDQC